MNENATITRFRSPLARLRTLIALTAACCAVLAIAAASAGAFGIEEFDGEVTLNPEGDPATQAGVHPYEAYTKIKFNKEGLLPEGNFKDLRTILPAGLIGNPNATPTCTIADFQEGEDVLERGQCPDNTVIGVAKVETVVFGLIWAPVYNLVPDPGRPARFGFHILTANIFINPSVRTGDDYGLDFTLLDSSQALPVTETELTFWGVPADPRHDGLRGKCLTIFGPSGLECPAEEPERPFLTNPTSCVGPVWTTLRANSWQEDEVWAESSFLSHDDEGEPVGAEGCEKLPFEPSLEVKATPGAAASPSSLTVDIHIPQTEGPNQLATAHLRKAVVQLPEGVAVNPSAANGLATCSPAEIGLDNADPVTCPAASKVGSATIETPLLRDPMQGSVYLAKQGENPNHNLLTIYLVAEGDGVLVKLPGRIETDPLSGRITATFDDNPQLPFEDLSVTFWGGAGAALVAPSACGTYEASATFTPWSGTAPVTDSDSFAVSTGPGGACPTGTLEPKLSAGSTNPTAGHDTGFVLNLSREDGTQALTGVAAKLPTGLLAKLDGVPYCPDAVLGSIPTAEGSGAAQLAAPSCPAASRIGSVAVASGAGTAPVYVDTGSAYLAGPYKDAPLSLAFVVPALAGPFDLGNVVVRAALEVDPTNAQVEVVSDPIPTILAGIPLNLRRLHVRIDREGFMVNPTSCRPSAVWAGVFGAGGAATTVSDRFQVGSCASLKLKPKLSLKLGGPTRRTAYPKLRAVLTQPNGQSNLRRAAVTLPGYAFLAQEHIKMVCTRAEWAADACPKGSVYGSAKAFSPLLEKPLKGRVYLRSSDHELPDLVADLRGQVDIELAGRIDSVKGAMRTTFEDIPDAPVTKFVLNMRGGKKSLIVNSQDLCRAKARSHVRIVGQNGKVFESRRRVGNDCRPGGKR